MSRIGKKPILIPEGVEVKINENEIIVKGPKGELSRKVRPEIKLEINSSQKIIIVSIQKENLEQEAQMKKAGAFWGLTRTLIFNMIEGVTKGHEKKLEIRGVGYKCNLEGEDLVLMVGYSHPVNIKKPEGISFNLEKNIIAVLGIDKALVGQTAAEIRSVKKPEPYKGKGIRYLGEEVKKKVGKKAVGSE